LILDTAGNLYGEIVAGGTYGRGTVFEETFGSVLRGAAMLFPGDALVERKVSADATENLLVSRAAFLVKEPSQRT
jgi:hypothetical protein